MKTRFLAVVALAAASCSDAALDTSSIRSFDRPVDLTVGCFGRLRVVGDNGVADPDDPVDFSAQPLSSCTLRRSGTAPANAPPGQEDLEGQNPLSTSMSWLEIVVQPTSGTIALLTQPEPGVTDRELTQGAFSIEDGDDLTPGHNALVVGSLPVAIATDTTGCYAITANAGSCDLSAIELTGLALGANEPVVRALPVLVGTEPLLARPAALASVDLDSPIGVACPDQPQGKYYVAYPDCHAVAVVDGATGQVVSSIRFADDGTPTIGDGALVCPRQCGTRDPVTDGARPVALDLMDDPRTGVQRLAIGLDNRPVVAVVTIEADGLPFAPRAVDLEGDIGVIDVALSRQMVMGGSLGLNDTDEDGVEAQFIYAVATDATVRVAEVLVAEEECDTQVDPRLLFDERDPTRVVCMPVGQIGTPRRRAGARSPGIEFTGQARPVAVTIITANNRVGVGQPDTWAGHFALVALSNGFVSVVNIDDDNYLDTYVPTDPLASVVTAAIPHQVRDAVAERTLDRERLDENEIVRINCNPGLQVDTNGFPIGGPRADSAATKIFTAAEISAQKTYTLPIDRYRICMGHNAQNEPVTVPVSDLTLGAATDVRERTFPDWRAVASEETWYLTWEGSLSLDGADNSIDGPSLRAGTVHIEGGGIQLHDAARPFCAAGVEPFDVVTLRGCDASRGDAQCGLDETCYVHPDATVAAGACLPTARLDELANRCRDYLVSTRRFAVAEAEAGVLKLHERKRILRTTPIDGCTSDNQCMDLAAYEATLTSDAHPKDETAAAPEHTYACEVDGQRPAALRRCVMTCSDDSQCEAGTLCRAGHCIEGIIPPPECATGLQLYDLRASDAFVAIGDRTGYVHPIVEDAAGRCVKDPDASPLQLGRFRLTAPPCPITDDPDDILPNPCSEQVQQAELAPVFTPGTCDLADDNGEVRNRLAPMIRFQNPAFRFELVDPGFPGDRMCRNDRLGALDRTGQPLGLMQTVYMGFVLRFHLSAGFGGGAIAGTRVVQPSNVVRSPDGTAWLLDAGDIDDGSIATPNIFGQVVRINPESPVGGTFVFQ